MIRHYGSRYKHRGHLIEYDEYRRAWVYSDTGGLIAADPDRPCGECNLPNRDDGHDACLGELPGVSNACCGHGVPEAAYVQFIQGDRVVRFSTEGCEIYKQVGE